MVYAIAGHHAGLPNMGDINSKRSDLYRRLKSCNPKLYSAWQTEVKLPELNIASAISRLSFSNEEEIEFSLLMYTHFILSVLVGTDRTNAQSPPFISPCPPYPSVRSSIRLFFYPSMYLYTYLHKSKKNDTPEKTTSGRKEICVYVYIYTKALSLSLLY